MEELSFKRGGKLNYPVINNSGNFELECEIFYAVSLQTIIVDNAIFEKAETDPEKYLKENMSDYLVAALHATWEKAIPRSEFPKLWKPMREAFYEVVEPELARFGLQLNDFAILTLSINDENEKALIDHEIKKTFSKEEMEAILNNVYVDECYKPWLYNTEEAKAPSFKTVEPWNCGECGMRNLTSLFCPQCGTPYKK